MDEDEKEQISRTAASLCEREGEEETEEERERERGKRRERERESGEREREREREEGRERERERPFHSVGLSRSFCAVPSLQLQLPFRLFVQCLSETALMQ